MRDYLGKPLPTDKSGQFLGDNNEPLPLDNWERPLDLDGMPLPTDHHGQFVYTTAGIIPTISGSVSPSPILSNKLVVSIPTAEEESSIQLLPTDGIGKEIFPVVSSQSGLPLPRNSEGRYLDDRNEVIIKHLILNNSIYLADSHR